MPGNTRIYWLHCLTPTHVGIGRGIGYIDLPVYREKITNWPSVPGSAFKGVWADHFRATDTNRRANHQLRLAFGVADDTKSSGSNAGALIPTDARLVCLPVRSFAGTFAWCTSQLALHLLQRDLVLSGFQSLPNLPNPMPDGQVGLCPGSAVKDQGKVFLEDLDFSAIENHPHVPDWADQLSRWVFPADWQDTFKKRFALLPDSVFDYLAETGTEVVTRVRIEDDTKAVAEGQLWTEEALPAESILAGLVSCDRVYDTQSSGVNEQTLLSTYATDPLTLQIGGKASVGRGKVRGVFTA